MSLGRILYRSEGGIDHYWVDNGDGKYVVTAVQQATPILDRNKAMATHNDGYSPSRDLRRVASIPFIVAMRWLNEEGWWCFDPENSDRLKRKLNSSDWAHLRTAPGRV